MEEQISKDKMYSQEQLWVEYFGDLIQEEIRQEQLKDIADFEYVIKHGW